MHTGKSVTQLLPTIKALVSFFFLSISTILARRINTSKAKKKNMFLSDKAGGKKIVTSRPNIHTGFCGSSIKLRKDTYLLLQGLFSLLKCTYQNMRRAL